MNTSESAIHTSSSRIWLAGRVDPLSRLLSGVRANSAVVHRTVLEPPFALRIDEEAHLALATALSGACVLVDADGQTATIEAGQVALIVGTDPFVLADRADTEVELVIRPDGLYTPAGQRVPPAPDLATCDLAPGGSTIVVSGSFLVAGQVSSRLVQSLPRFAVCDLAADDLAIGLLSRELDVVSPGRDAVLDRWLDLALVSTLRRWFADAERRPGWYVGLSHPIVAPALRALHENLSTPWTVATLAARSACSRSSFAATFTAVVGQPPMTYLAQTRLDAAADLLLAGEASLSQVAEQVGYSSAFAFSAAFKRHTGFSPAQWRHTQRPA